jgi:hypothetical protein
MSELLEGQSGEMLVSFDGRVLELFGFSNPVRYHVNEVEARVKGPDKKGRYEVTIGSRWRGMAQFHVEGADWPAIEPVIEAARAASAPPT